MNLLINFAAMAVLAGLSPAPAVAVDPQTASAMIEQARGLLAADRTDAAIERLTAALRLDPSNAAAHNALGSLLNSIGRYAEAAAAC
ncbi:MAG: tetratricopeptide repeat protein [Sphingomicrobium sp.]